MKLSIIIPAYNEEKTIEEVIRRVKKSKIKNIKKEIIVIDDCSTDNTFKIVSKIKGIKLIKNKKNLGKGGSVKKGFQISTGDILIIQDADLEYDPNDYWKLIKPIINKQAKVVYGSRRLNKKNKKYSGLSFYLGGVFVTLMTNLLYPGINLTDEPTCYKVFNSEIIKKIKLNGNKFEWEPEITAKIYKKKIKILEIPISYHPRSVKEGKKINWKDGLQAIWTLIKYRFVD